MKMKINIRTITPVHIGSGETLYRDNDFCLEKDSEGYDVIGVTDPGKILSLIGQEHISDWLFKIEDKRPVTEIVSKFAPKGKRGIEHYTSRLIDNEKCYDSETLKEFIHNGNNKPYIPGSSIKGAIRTAILATVAKNADIDWLLSKNRHSAQKVEEHFFGDIQSDVFRFLHIGDAVFGECFLIPTISLMMINLNERRAKGYKDESKKQLIEALSKDDESSFELHFNSEAYTLAEKNGQTKSLPTCMSSGKDFSITKLFRTINSHTQMLIESEIEHWEEKADDDGSGFVNKYIDKLKDLKGIADGCKNDAGKSCLLRIGHGSGWRFITGAWTKRNKDFPKSRRVSKDLDLLGFVKLSQESQP